MRMRVIAVGSRMPEWVRDNCADYSKRLSPYFKLALVEIAAAPRSGAKNRAPALASEGERLLGALGPKDFAVALDERGRELTTREFADWLARRLQAARDLAFLIGGADGLADAVRARCDMQLSLSRLTLPHALARVLLFEQLYRAQSLLANHPYHRD
jgi:23S rRNA (pseudouridine1915-N3)-methyltransferase